MKPGPANTVGDCQPTNPANGVCFPPEADDTSFPVAKKCVTSIYQITLQQLKAKAPSTGNESGRYTLSLYEKEGSLQNWLYGTWALRGGLMTI